MFKYITDEKEINKFRNEKKRTSEHKIIYDITSDKKNRLIRTDIYKTYNANGDYMISKSRRKNIIMSDEEHKKFIELANINNCLLIDYIKSIQAKHEILIIVDLMEDHEELLYITEEEYKKLMPDDEEHEIYYIHQQSDEKITLKINRNAL